MRGIASECARARECTVTQSKSVAYAYAYACMYVSVPVFVRRRAYNEFVTDAAESEASWCVRVQLLDRLETPSDSGLLVPVEDIALLYKSGIIREHGRSTPACHKS